MKISLTVSDIFTMLLSTKFLTDSKSRHLIIFLFHYQEKLKKVFLFSNLENFIYDIYYLTMIILNNKMNNYGFKHNEEKSDVSDKRSKNDPESYKILVR